MTNQSLTVHRITRATHSLPEIAALFRPRGLGRFGSGIACWIPSALATAPGLTPQTLTLATHRLPQSEAVAIQLVPTKQLELTATELDSLWRTLATEIAVKAKTLIAWSTNTAQADAGLTILGYTIAPCGTRLGRRLAWFTALERAKTAPEATWPIRLLIKRLTNSPPTPSQSVPPALAPATNIHARSVRSRSFDTTAIIRYPWQTPLRGKIRKQRQAPPRNYQERISAVQAWWKASQAHREARRLQWADLPYRLQRGADTPPETATHGNRLNTERLLALANIIRSTTSAGPRAYPMHLAETSSWRFSMFEPDILYHPGGAAITGITGLAERLWGSFGLDGSPALRAWAVLGLSPREATMLVHFDDVELADDEWPLLLRSITALHAERVLRTKARTPKRSLKVIWADVLCEANLIVAHSPDRWTMTAQARALAERAYISLCDEVLQNLPRTQRTQRNADQYLWAQHRAGVEIEFKAAQLATTTR